MSSSLKDIDDIFSPFTAAISKFAEENGLRVDKCPRGNSGWELVGDHAVGGTVILLLMYDQVLGIGVGSVWQFPCAEMSILYSHFRAIRPCEMDAGKVLESLRIERREINSVVFGYWTHLTPMQIAQ